MARAKPAKQRRRKTALPAFRCCWGVSGDGRRCVSKCTASNCAGTRSWRASCHYPRRGGNRRRQLGDVLRLRQGKRGEHPEAGVQLARGCGGCGCRGCGGRGCAVRGCGGCRAVACRGCGASLSGLSRLWLRRMWVRWLRLRLLLGNRAFACVLDQSFRSSAFSTTMPADIALINVSSYRRDASPAKGTSRKLKWC